MLPFHMNFLEIEGAPRQCGQIHGEALREQIREIQGFFMQQNQLADEAALERLCWQVLGQTGLIEAARKWTPELAEEIEGICEGAGVGPGSIWAFQFQDELISLSVDQQLKPGLQKASNTGCTSLGSAPQNGYPAILAQNLDTPAIYHGRQTLLKLRYRGSPIQAFIVTEPGLVGICGLNNHGLGVCQNTLASQMSRSRQGLAAMLVARRLLSFPSLDKAVEFLKAVPHASGINYALGDPRGVADYECSPQQVNRFLPPETPDKIYHTNHPLVNEDRYPLERLPGELQEFYGGAIRNSRTRFEALQERVTKKHGPLAVKDIKHILCSHDSSEFPICRHERLELGPMGGRTNNSVIMVLSAQPELHIASEEPCSAEFRVFRF